MTALLATIGAALTWILISRRIERFLNKRHNSWRQYRGGCLKHSGTPAAFRPIGTKIGDEIDETQHAE